MSHNSNETPLFTTTEREACIVKLQEIENSIASHLRSLTPQERKKTLPMGDKSTAFMRKTIQYSKEFKEVIPGLLNVEEMEQNFTKAQELDYVIRKTEMLLDGMKDARMEAAGIAYDSGLKVYKILQTASCLELPGITAALEELGKRFSGQGRVSNSAENKAAAKADQTESKNATAPTLAADNGVNFETLPPAEN